MSRSHAPLVRVSARWLSLACALVLGGCSSRMPLAPERVSHSYSEHVDSDSYAVEDVVAIVMAPGASWYQLQTDYAATTVAWESGGCCMLPGGTETPAELAQRMAGDPRVQSVEPDRRLESPEARQESYAFDDGHGNYSTYGEQPAAKALGLYAAHRASDGKGVLVAILDTGADLGHPALAGRVVAGRDCIGHDNNPTDQPDGIDNDGDGLIDEAYGHGTHVAGIVALTAPGAKLLIVRVLDADGRGDVLGVASGIRRAVDAGARVINMSLGMVGTSQAIQNALEYAASHGVVCICSAGNWGSDSPQEFPALSSHAIAVAAVDAQRQPAPFTSFGSFVALCAPGIGIRSAYPGGGYVLWSGTSMSTPFVSGAVALLLSVHPEWNGNDVMQRLTQTVGPLVGVLPGQSGNLGAGSLDVAAALSPDLPATPPQGDPTERPLRR